MGVGTTAIAALMHNRKAMGAEILPEYLEIARKRIKLAEKGKLKIRPMKRSVYDPHNKTGNNLPPQYVKLNSFSEQLSFIQEKQTDYLKKP